MRAHSGRQLSGAGSPQSGAFSLPSAVDPLPGQAWKEVTFSKVCLNRDDMWMCWHEQRSRLPTTASHAPARKAAAVVFFPLFFFSLLSLLFFFSFPPEKKQLSARENKIIVCFNGCSIPQVYPDLKIPIKWRTGLDNWNDAYVNLGTLLLLLPEEFFLSLLIKQFFD